MVERAIQLRFGLQIYHNSYFKKSQLQLFAEVSVLILIANSISKRAKLKDLHFLISKHFTKCQLSKHCGTGIRTDIYSNGI